MKLLIKWLKHMWEWIVTLVLFIIAALIIGMYILAPFIAIGILVCAIGYLVWLLVGVL